jgi:tetratricopeptide (TPR) repeat protein
VLRSHPQDVFALNNKAVALMDLGKHRAALTWLQKSRRLDPEESSTLYNMGIVLARLGRVAASVAAFRKSLRIRSRALVIVDPSPAYCLGNAWLPPPARLNNRERRYCSSVLSRSHAD